MILISVILLLIYGCIILLYDKKLKLTHYTDQSNTPVAIPATLLICCKNEEKNLQKLLDAISKQTYNNLQIIFVDDNSTDNTSQILQQFTRSNNHTRLLQNPHSGKKTALEYGMTQVNTPWVILTDADCTIHPQHIETILNHVQIHQPDMVLAPVSLAAPSNSIFYTAQKLEFNALMAATAGAAAAQKPIMCNGANIAFSKTVWDKYHNNLHHKYSSGDDQFLMLNLKKNQGKIDFIIHPNTIVQTQATASWNDFINQRKRWASKAPGYRDTDLITTALSVFLLNSWIVTLAIASSINPIFLPILLATWMIKTAIDYKLLANYLKAINQTHLLKYTPLVQLLYPFYIVIAACGGILGKFKWKNTTLRR